ncbi:alpha/beta fold hydrolase [Microcoleus sp. FACHB-1515]|uniref:alpha/beta hydrolase n=1 Tax=Cyanophyceae TaxID=3028117 RepID=UPI0016882729|nr:alpha/beta fold hydrolase [Microcoleus sp. FACHB-1515]MBD2093205.1 alpha/beta fold hydrolase [Microcoleus sp. FACHB-1515]
MASYADITQTLVDTARSREDLLPIRAEECRSLLQFQPPKHPVCLLFHGFTAAPFQWQAAAESLFQAGYNIVAPRLPGHAQAGTWWQGNPPPLPTQVEDYERFALAWIQQAQAISDRVIVAGLGAGATLAAWLALEQVHAIDRAILIDPYLGQSRQVVDLFVRSIASYCEWLEPEPPVYPTGYSGFALRTLQPLLQMGETVMQQVQQVPIAPVFLISSGLGDDETRQCFDFAVRSQPRSWYCRFEQLDELPHKMLTLADSDNYQTLLAAIVRSFNESELTGSELQGIVDRTRQGETVAKAIGSLNLGDRASGQLAALFTPKSTSRK